MTNLWRVTVLVIAARGVMAVAAAGLLALCGCASTSRPASDAWVGGDPAHLSADTATCREESSGVDVNAAGGYTDPRYGMTSAMAAAVAKDNPLTDTTPQIRAAAFATCMTDKGWHQP
jgi:hypothetical protein